MKHPGPILLNIETSGLTCGVSISRGDQLLATLLMNEKNIHSRKLGVFVHHLLRETEIKPADISAIAVSAGPGSFTGLRIGFSFAKGMAQALNIPILPVPTLSIWAYQLGMRSEAILPIIDARREEIFIARYYYNTDGFQEVESPTLISLNALSTWIEKEPCILTGVDAQRLERKLQSVIGHVPLVWSAPHPQLWALATLGYRAYQAGNWNSLTEVEPLYMRAFKGVL